jgi:WD40 repeat protein
MSAWFFDHNDQIHGPFALGQLEQLLQAGVLSLDQDVWSTDSTTVVVLSELSSAVAAAGVKRSLFPWLVTAALLAGAIAVSYFAERINLLDYAMSRLEGQADLIDAITPIGSEPDDVELPEQPEAAANSDGLAEPETQASLLDSKVGLARTLRGRGHVTCLAFCTGDTLAVSGSTDRSVRLWDLERGKLVWKNNRFSRDLLAVYCTPTEVVACDRQGIHRLDLTTGRTLGLRRIEACSNARFSANGEYIATEVANGEGRLIELTTKSVTKLVDSPGPFRFCAFTPDTTRLVFGDDALHVYHRPTEQIRENVHKQLASVSSIDIASNGLYVATGHGRDALKSDRVNHPIAKVWEIGSGRIVVNFGGHKNWISAIRFTGDGRRVISAGGGSQGDTLGYEDSADRGIRVWDTRSGKLYGHLEGHSAAVLCLDISQDNRLLISGSADGTLRVWKLPD